MMYVAGATEYHNRAIYISLANAHIWDHIRLAFYLKGFPKSMVSIVTRPSPIQPLRTVTKPKKFGQSKPSKVKTQPCQAVD